MNPAAALTLTAAVNTNGSAECNCRIGSPHFIPLCPILHSSHEKLASTEVVNCMIPNLSHFNTPLRLISSHFIASHGKARSERLSLCVYPHVQLVVAESALLARYCKYKGQEDFGSDNDWSFIIPQPHACHAQGNTPPSSLFRPISSHCILPHTMHVPRATGVC